MSVGEFAMVKLAGCRVRGSDTFAPRLNAMTLTEQITEALDLKTLNLPAGLPVEDLEFEEIVDSTGEDAIQITIIIPEEIDVEHVSGKDVLELKDRIRQRLRQRGLKRFAYCGIAKRSELEAAPDEDED
jgi:hypothetical protein